MAESLTARTVADRMRAKLGSPWVGVSGDGFQTGSPDTVVTGIVTTWSPTMDVLRRAVAAGANMIVARESAFWSRGAEVPGYSGAGATAKQDDMVRDPTFVSKRAFIEEHRLVLCRFSTAWDAREPDGQLRGLVAALGWQPRALPRRGFFGVPPSTLDALAADVRTRLNVRAMRVLGDPQATVRKVALTHGFLLVPEVQAILKEPDVDVIIAGEPVEWEAFPYMADMVTASRAKGMILIGHAVSEEPGSGEVAAWLRPLVGDVPVHFLPAGEPFWMPA